MYASRAVAEAAGGLEGEESPAQREVRARSVYERAFTEMRADQPAAKEEALMLLEAWRDFESACTAKCASQSTLTPLTPQPPQRSTAGECSSIIIVGLIIASKSSL